MSQAYTHYPNNLSYPYVSQDVAAPRGSFLLRFSLFAAVVMLVLVSGSQLSTENSAMVTQVSMIGLALAALVLGFVGCGWRIRLPAESALILLFVLWGASGLLVAEYPSIFLEDYKTLVKTVALYFLLVNVVRSRSDLLWMMAGYICSVLFFYFFLGHEAFNIQQGSRIERASGVTGDANGTATYAIMCSIGAGMFFARSKGAWRILWLLPMPLFMYMVFASGSRSGMLATMVGWGLVYWWYIRGQVRERGAGTRFGAMVLGIALVFVISAALVMGPFWHRIEKTFGFGEYTGTGGSVTTETRTEMTIAGLKLAAANPLLGVGYGHYKIGITQYDVGLIGRSSHNTWIDAASTTGLPGLALWAAAYVLLTRRIWRLRQNPSLPLVDRGIVSLLLVFMAVWWFRSFFFVHMGEKIMLPFVAAITGYLVTLKTVYGAPRALSPKHRSQSFQQVPAVRDVRLQHG